MSSGLDVDFGESNEKIDSSFDQPLTAYIESETFSSDEQLVSIEESSDGMIICLDVASRRAQFAKALIQHVQMSVMILGEQFNARIFKLEFGRAYLSLLR
jgi:hypothetical protein